MSFSIGLSGLRAVNQELSIISNNVANASTAGFKSSRAEFAAIYGGGQAGGVEMNNVSQNFDRNGDMTRTGRGLDLAISGSGFFVLKDGSGQTSYTRAGMFQRDNANYLTTAGGTRLQGYTTDDAGKLQSGVVGDIQVKAGSLPAKPSDKLEFVANLKADASIIPVDPKFDPNKSNTFSYSQSSKVYDSLGTEHTVTQYFVKKGANAWDVHYSFNGADVTPAAGAKMIFDPNGKLDTGASTIPPSLALKPAGASPIELQLDMSRVSQYASDFNATRNQSNGYTAGDLTGVRVDGDGGVYATFTNGQSLLQGQVVMANFTNPNGLLQTNNTSWQQSFSSGQPVLGAPGTGTMGKLTAGAYESSNVDLTGELVSLMTSQRNYQANAKTISSADKMSQILFNSF
ncbi:MULTISPECIES: lateral flagellar hook protein FlgEL [Aeromonas]|uniref:lateral flagellar hook protein FlgEL n=1 Tax=Aeromonas TaxID=642 RepID=UPI0003A762E8|nr:MULTISPECIES: lateral flagellar hook protein FlgEL [unclassified Aeromonas]ANB67576.1 flagellar biosynthesis protein FlgE [Aeromonas veronii]MBW3781011.1 flagellar basal body protein FlaE [Aeromonas veronii]MCJ8216800.1 lateral flagellar hook protein FlgEL [Aeromonas veronii]NJI11713.1 flagellar basal body protein FlaE [Aeromonas veronii]QHB81041.1 flagellar basal body protein FlaE [Aeromonas veronii]